MLAPTSTLASRRARLYVCSLVLVALLSCALWFDYVPGAVHVRTAASHHFDKLIHSSPFGTGSSKDSTEQDSSSADVEYKDRIANDGSDEAPKGTDGDKAQPAPDTSDHIHQSDLLGGVRREKIIITGAQQHEDVSWIQNELPDWDHAIYSVDDGHAPLHTAANKGNEANPYLKYIIDHYNDLPEIMVFLHPHKDGFWHEDQFNNLDAVRRLNLDFVRRENYTSLRCNHDPGCPHEITGPYDDPERKQQYTFAQYWPRMFPEQPQMPEMIGAPCCSQFAVTRGQVLARPLEDYERYLEIIAYSNVDNYYLGRVFEYSWHIIFGKEPIYCPPPDQCYMDMWGWELPKPEPPREMTADELRAKLEELRQHMAAHKEQEDEERKKAEEEEEQRKQQDAPQDAASEVPAPDDTAGEIKPQVEPPQPGSVGEMPHDDDDDDYAYKYARRWLA